MVTAPRGVSDGPMDRSAPIVVVATDGSDEAVAALGRLRRVLPRAARWEIVTTVPHPPDPVSGETGFASPIMTPDEAGDRARADLVAGDAALAATARALGAVPTRSTVAHGDLATAVAEHARSVAAHVVVVAAPGTSAIDELLGRSDADEVLAAAPCPVLILPVPPTDR
jgi:nucleotide-binding universal stress UspA family protein